MKKGKNLKLLLYFLMLKVMLDKECKKLLRWVFVLCIYVKVLEYKEIDFYNLGYICYYECY